jgi:hypothetical protein
LIEDGLSAGAVGRLPRRPVVLERGSHGGAWLISNTWPISKT